MADNEPPELVQAVIGDIRAVGWRKRLQTVALTAGILAFGFMLGVHFYAGTTMSAIPPTTAARLGVHEALSTTYENAMKTGAVVAIVGIAGSEVAEWFATESDAE